MFNHYRPTWMEVDLNALAHNYRMIANKVHPKVVVPVIKANAYGLGAGKVVGRLIKEDVSLFAVSLVEEAIRIRQSHDNIDIMIIGVLTEKDLEVCAKYDFIASISNMSLLNKLKSMKTSLRCHFEVETGMHRLGIDNQENLIDFLKKIDDYPQITVEGIYSHFASSDQDETYTFLQADKYHTLLKRLPFLPKMRHLSNTSAALKYEQCFHQTTHVRSGIGIYGLSLEKEDYGLKNVMTLKTKVTDIKSLFAGEALGYGLTYVAKETIKIAVLPIGYADGFLRAYQGANVSINHKKYQVIGRISMDMTLIKIDDYVEIGDEVVLMGNQDVSIDDMANYIGTINYEVLCNITNRVPRVYKE